MLPLLLVVLASICCGYAIWCSTYWQRRGFQGPLGFPLCGNMLQFFLGRKHYGDVYEELYNAFPKVPYVGIYRLFNEPVILLRSEEMIKEVMVRNFQHFQDNVLYIDPKRDEMAHCNPFVARGDNWKQRRTELVPIFTPNKVKLSFPHILSVCAKLEKYVEQNMAGNCFEAKDLFSKYTLNVVASAGYGIDAEAFTNAKSDFTQLVEHIFMPNPWSLVDTTALLFSPLLNKLMNYRYLPVDMQKWMSSIINRVLAQRLQPKNVAETSDFLQWLIEGKQKLNEPINNDVIVGHCSTFLVEGFETSSSLMAFALYQFATNDRAQKRALQEIDEVLSRYGGELCYEALQEMHYVEASLMETLRLQPAMATLLKTCTKAFVLPPQHENCQALAVQPGTIFVVPVKAIHYDKNIYPEPFLFDPERFLAQNEKQGCKFLGFGEGPRMCPGMRFGLAQSKAGLVTLLRKYTVYLAPTAVEPLKISPTTFLTAAKDGIWLSFKQRV